MNGGWIGAFLPSRSELLAVNPTGLCYSCVGWWWFEFGVQLEVLLPGSVQTGKGLLGRTWGHQEVPEELSSTPGTAEVRGFPCVPRL